MWSFRIKTLRQKLISSIIISILVTLLMANFAYYIILSINNKQIYNQLTTNIKLSSENLSQNFDTIRQFSSIIVADKELQNLLVMQKEANDYQDLRVSVDGLSTIINIYFDQLQKYHVDYIILNGSKAKNNTFIPSEETLPEQVENDLMNIAQQFLGEFKLVTEYNDTYGLFMVYSIRRIANAEFDYLGTLILKIDTKEVLDYFISNRQNYNNILYRLLDQNNESLFVSKEIGPQVSQKLNINPLNTYKIISLNNNDYMEVGSKIFQDWTIFSYLPYNDITRTSNFLMRLTILIIFLIAVFSIIVTYFFIGKQVSTPIHQLVEQMESFGSSTNKNMKELEKYTIRNDEIGYLYKKYDEMTNNISELIEVNYKQKILYKESQLQYLQSQINPHFLYNTLDSINWRAKKAQDRITSQMVQSLAAVLRSSLSTKKSFSLHEEIQIIMHYLNIQKIRYGNILSYEINCDDKHMDTEFPHMVLQPIVENAIRYSLEYNGEDCHIFVNSHIYEDKFVLTVKNTGSNFKDNHLQRLEENSIKTNGFGIGLVNINKRIKLHYGNNYGLSLYNEEEMAIVAVNLPVRHVNKENTNV